MDFQQSLFFQPSRIWKKITQEINDSFDVKNLGLEYMEILTLYMMFPNVLHPMLKIPNNYFQVRHVHKSEPFLSIHTYGRDRKRSENSRTFLHNVDSNIYTIKIKQNHYKIVNNPVLNKMARFTKKRGNYSRWFSCET